MCLKGKKRNDEIYMYKSRRRRRIASPLNGRCRGEADAAGAESEVSLTMQNTQTDIENKREHVRTQLWLPDNSQSTKHRYSHKNGDNP